MVREACYTNLGELVGYPDLAEFIETKFEKFPFLARTNHASFFKNILSTHDIDQFFARIKYRTAECFCVNGDQSIDVSQFSTRGVVDSRKALRLFANGATIILNRVHLYHEPLQNFCVNLAKELSAPCQANAYITPPNSQGFKAHYDTHDVFIIQITGSKIWKIYNREIDLPLASQGSVSTATGPNTPTLELELNEGQVLYIPRGWVHEAKTTSALSLHVTLGVFFFTWADAILEFVSHCVLNEPRLRGSLPLGFLLRREQDLSKNLQTLIREVSISADFPLIVAAFEEQLSTQMERTTSGLLRQITKLSSLNEESLIRAKPHFVAECVEQREGIKIKVAGGDMMIDRKAAGAVSSCLAGQPVQIKELFQFISIDDAFKLVHELIVNEVIELID